MTDLEPRTETRSEYVARKLVDRGRFWLRWHHDMERCTWCGLARCNVRHTVNRDNAPEGAAYYVDVPFCGFKSHGDFVDGADRVNGYRSLPEAERMAGMKLAEWRAERLKDVDRG